MSDGVSGPGERGLDFLRRWADERGLTDETEVDLSLPPGLEPRPRSTALARQGFVEGERVALQVSEAEEGAGFAVMPASRQSTVIARELPGPLPGGPLIVGRREGVRGFLSPALATEWEWRPVPGLEPELDAFVPRGGELDDAVIEALVPWLASSIGIWGAVTEEGVWAIGPALRARRSALDCLWSLASVLPAAVRGEPLPRAWPAPAASHPRGGHGDPFREVSDALEGWASSRGMALFPQGSIPHSRQRLLPKGESRYLRGAAGASIAGRTTVLGHLTSASTRSQGPGDTDTTRVHRTVVGVEVSRARGFVETVQINARQPGFDPPKEPAVRPLHLESTMLAERFEVLIGAGDDENRARQLFSPSFVDWLATEAPELSFAYRGGTLLGLAPGHEESAAALDAIWEAASRIAERLDAEASEGRLAA